MSEIRDDYDPSMDAKTGRDRRRKITIRHNRAAVAGVHLPSIQEILMGSPWHGDDLLADFKVFAERTLPRVKTDNVKGRDVANALAAQVRAQVDAHHHTLVAALQIFSANEAGAAAEIVPIENTEQDVIIPRLGDTRGDSFGVQ